MSTEISFSDIDKITLNRYEAVLIAAQRARQINSLRLAQLERMLEENVTIDIRKVTTIALLDLANDKLNIHRPGLNK